VAPTTWLSLTIARIVNRESPRPSYAGHRRARTSHSKDIAVQGHRRVSTSPSNKSLKQSRTSTAARRTQDWLEVRL